MLAAFVSNMNYVDMYIDIYIYIFAINKKPIKLVSLTETELEE